MRNSSNFDKPYLVEIKTCCRREPRTGKRFCDEWLAEFRVRDQSSGDILFLESLHPLEFDNIAGRMLNEADERNSPGKG